MSEKSNIDQYLDYVRAHMKGMFSFSTWHEHTTGVPGSKADCDDLIVNNLEDIDRAVLKAVVGSGS